MLCDYFEHIKDDKEKMIAAEVTRNQVAKIVAKHFGTESTVARKNDYYDSWTCEDKKGRTWKVSKDVSIHASSELKKAELITPILTYEDLNDLQEITRDLRKAGAISNPDHGCGVHYDKKEIMYSKNKIY